MKEWFLLIVLSILFAFICYASIQVCKHGYYCYKGFGVKIEFGKTPKTTEALDQIQIIKLLARGEKFRLESWEKGEFAYLDNSGVLIDENNKKIADQEIIIEYMIEGYESVFFYQE